MLISDSADINQTILFSNPFYQARLQDKKKSDAIVKGRFLLNWE